MSRRFVASVLPLLAVLGGTAPAQAEPPTGEDRLVVSVSRSGNPEHDGTWELTCHPAGGSHPWPQLACDHLDEVTVWGEDPFAPVPDDALCTEQYGGPAVGRIRGTWAGRAVDARFSRTNGCEIGRWDAMGAVLMPAEGVGAFHGMPVVYRDAGPHGPMPAIPLSLHAEPGLAP
ncbi:subtilase-type protease inhibitor [Streptomyces sp. NBC_00237]|uniref:SSI family serine proteinase inhibitor n=1 Tax=Streptomyces sp. NBC_00237 TaxID=2975687 RepID=UPI002252FEE4|nr:SSI family serine proteinase inhibitor [Streptomyces sp. NBC_00237]MCX5200592.1 subtilase-type protease inhibitor [Streptomyces sp. NBC_00237]